MKPTRTNVLAGLSAVMFSSVAVANDDSRNGPSDDYFYGTYEIVGRVRDKPSETYAGSATLTVGDGRIEVARCVNGAVTRGHLKFVEGVGERRSSLQGLLGVGDRAWCDFTNDGDNYARLTCFLTSADGPQPEHFGLEFYVAVHGPDEDDPRICR